MNKFCVYMHTNRINGKRYIGITCQKPNQRWRNGKGYKNGYFANAIQKYGWDCFIHEILYDNISEDMAKQIEINLISKYNTMDKQYGYNLVEGGNVTTGYSHTVEAKRKMSNSKKGMFSGKNNPMYGKCGELAPAYGIKRSKEFCEAVSERNRRRVLSDETKLKIKNNHADFKGGKHPQAKKVVQYTLDGLFIKKWDCINDIERTFGFYNNQIGKCCRGQIKKSYGYIWRYDDESEEYNDD